MASFFKNLGNLFKIDLSALSSKVDKIEKDVTTLNKTSKEILVKINNLENKDKDYLKTIETQIQNLSNQFINFESKINDCESKLNDCESKLNDFNVKLDTLEKRVETLEKKKSVLDDIPTVGYVSGNNAINVTGVSGTYILKYIDEEGKELTDCTEITQ